MFEPSIGLVEVAMEADCVVVQCRVGKIVKHFVELLMDFAGQSF